MLLNSSMVYASDDAKILEQGEISTDRYVTGGVLGTIFGFGIGHAVTGKGMYADNGWMFTAGEITAFAVFWTGASSCVESGERWTHFREKECTNSQSLAINLGYLAFLGLRVWEVVDIWVSPLDHNDRYRALKAKEPAKTSFYLIPSPTAPGGSGVVLGLNSRF